MYVPASFAETEPARQFEFIEAHSFGLLVSGARADGAIVASHLPLLLDPATGPQGRLVGHMARANGQWREIADREVLCVFSGPHAYISPAWYDQRDVVPTWNYVAVHAYGTCRIVDDTERTAQIVARAVVGFEIDISRIEGKWKLGQNHPPERRDKVARGLQESGDAGAREIGRLMRETIRRDS
jgi:transcriptional regulator